MKRLFILSSILIVSCKPAKVNIPEPKIVEEEQSADAQVEDVSDDGEAIEEDAAADESESALPTIDPLDAMKALDGASLELPCKDFVSTKFDCSTVGDINRGFVMGGDADKVYEVVLRVRGAVEPMTYSGGTGSDGSRLYVGGLPSNKDFNIYSMTTENPKQVYYLNAKASVGAYIDAVDYTMKIKVSGNSTVKLFASAQNGTIISNTKPVTVPGITKSADVGQGQFLQLNVITAKEVAETALKLKK
jgi:hypothetical protein